MIFAGHVIIPCFDSLDALDPDKLIVTNYDQPWLFFCRRNDNGQLIISANDRFTTRDWMLVAAADPTARHEYEMATMGTHGRFCYGTENLFVRPRERTIVLRAECKHIFNDALICSDQLSATADLANGTITLCWKHLDKLLAEKATGAYQGLFHFRRLTTRHLRHQRLLSLKASETICARDEQMLRESLADLTKAIPAVAPVVEEAGHDLKNLDLAAIRTALRENLPPDLRHLAEGDVEAECPVELIMNATTVTMKFRGNMRIGDAVIHTCYTMPEELRCPEHHDMLTQLFEEPPTELFAETGGKEMRYEFTDQTDACYDHLAESAANLLDVLNRHFVAFVPHVDKIDRLLELYRDEDNVELGNR
jgi:hypothetical protein